jgi:tetratricopeptide (TPR) repeat protein
MKIQKNIIKISSLIFFFIIIFNTVYAKTTDKYNKSDKISNYFSGIVSLYDNEYLTSYKHLKKLEGLEKNHLIYSQIYQHTLVNLKKFDKAYDFSKKIKNKNPNDFQSNLIIGLHYLKYRQYKVASNYFQELSRDTKQNNPLTNLLAISLNGWSIFPNIEKNEALNYLNKLPKNFGNVIKIQKTFAHCFYNSNNTQEEFIKLTSDKKTDFSRYNFFLANYMQRSSQVSEAIEIVKSSLNNYPKNLLLKQLFEDIKKKNNGKFSDKFNCQNPAHVVAEILYIASNAMATQSAYQLSNFYLNLAMYLNSDFVSYKTLYAENFYMINSMENSKKIYKDIKNSGSVYKWHAAKQISKILIKENDKEEAIKMLKINFSEIASPTIDQIYDYAEFLKNNEKYKQSIQHYTKIINSIKEDHYLYPRATDGRGVANERLGKWKKAENDFLNSLRIKPDQPYVLNYLAYSWIEQGVKIEKSLDMIKKANELKKNDGYITDSLGWAFFKLKRFKEAKKYLQLAVRIMPSDPVVNDHYGDSLWMINKKVQARYYWENVLKLEKTEEELKKKIKKKLIFGLSEKI